MKGTELTLGYMPLVDSAPFFVARDMGFAAEEGLSLNLRPAPSWSSLRDMLAFGQIDAAHMLAPVPVASAMGFGIAGKSLVAPMVLSVNGNVIGVSADLAARLRGQGHDFGFDDAAAAGKALIGAGLPRLRIGVPFPFSMHAELLYYWLSALGLPAPQGLDIRTVPPPLMADAIAAGEIDAFCVGEPWGSFTVQNNVGALLLPTNAIWSFAPEKVLAMREDFATSEPALTARLIRALWKACRWLSQPGSHTIASEILSQPRALDLPEDLLDRALSGRLLTSPRGAESHVPGFVEFHRGAANFPWASQAQWIARQLAQRTGLDQSDAARAASVFRSDIYRAALRGQGANLPAGAAKIEGATAAETEISGDSGLLTLQPNRFFDGQIFDSAALID